MLRAVVSLALAHLALLSAGVRSNDFGTDEMLSQSGATAKTHQVTVRKSATDLEAFMHFLSTTESGIESEWFWRSGCRRWRNDRRTKIFYFQWGSGSSTHTVRLTRDAADPLLEVWADHEWHVALDDKEVDGVRWTAVPKNGGEVTNATVVHLFEADSVQYSTTPFHEFFFIMGFDLEFLDGLFLEPHLVRIGLEDGSLGQNDASGNRALGASYAYDETRFTNFTITGARVGLSVANIVVPIAGVTAVFAMASVGLWTAIFGSLLGYVGVILGGSVLGGVAAGLSGIGQALGLVKERVVMDRIGAEQKIWQELRCMRGFKECPVLAADDPASGETPHQVIAPKGKECPVPPTEAPTPAPTE